MGSTGVWISGVPQNAWKSFGSGHLKTNDSTNISKNHKDVNLFYFDSFLGGLAKQRNCVFSCKLNSINMVKVIFSSIFYNCWNPCSAIFHLLHFKFNQSIRGASLVSFNLHNSEIFLRIFSEARTLRQLIRYFISTYLRIYRILYTEFNQSSTSFKLMICIV
jgi:hypothetical protein